MNFVVAQSMQTLCCGSAPEEKGTGIMAEPINEADRIDDWLYLPETLYALVLIIVVTAGAGPYNLDALILGLMNKHFA
jgi:hypothetical protein